MFKSGLGTIILTTYLAIHDKSSIFSWFRRPSFSPDCEISRRSLRFLPIIYDKWRLNYRKIPAESMATFRKRTNGKWQAEFSCRGSRFACTFNAKLEARAGNRDSYGGYCIHLDTWEADLGQHWLLEIETYVSIGEVSLNLKQPILC